MTAMTNPRGNLAGRTYLERGQPVLVLASWRTGSRCPRNVWIRREDGTETVRPFRGLRKPPEAVITTAAYDAVAAAYAARWAGMETAAVEALGRFASELRPGALVLDLGCGPGRDLRWLTRHGYCPIGLDRSSGMLGHAIRSASGVPVIRGDMARLPFRSDAVDGLWSCASFLHTPKREAPAVLAEFARVLHAGGLLGLTVKRGDGEGWTATRGLRFFAWWQPDELDAALAAAGFRVAWAAVSPDPLGREPWLERIAIRHESARLQRLAGGAR